VNGKDIREVTIYIDDRNASNSDIISRIGAEEKLKQRAQDIEAFNNTIKGPSYGKGL
jgi:hypothetical protein